ncbi:glutathione S-transferase C-terminal domain-containing protein [Agarivorans aestuarii]|uniref:Glutathione S-transferase C-terminal domain-containing protein n=1 Tax=Agarivorans aestuarii TaxID=1563703 RepID=A0ABU7G2Y1_9ALTE|nr:glutathione S-transferase C-terminal domain-containing protein [Agarivorans aestuarii]MEE1673746.1 glutathione S-transferase C-terminal domain-containing protein [Agarivorans aestuarii]
MLVNGVWTEDWQPLQKADEQGRFVRQTSGFRNWITADGSPGPTGEGGFKAEAGRYRLYVALICPWASRTLIARKLKGLEELIPVTVLNPSLSSQGWRFGGYQGADQDPLFASSYMHQIYTRADPSFTGRATVPVLWDMQKNVIVNNESADILRMFDSAFEQLVPSNIRLYPEQHSEEIDALNARIYHQFNNGVYKAGFTQSQTAYQEAVTGVFELLEELEQRLARQQYLIGGELTETDIRTFVTLIRFDLAYYGLFKTNRKQIADYPLLSAYMQRILALPGVAETVNVDHITRGYYSIKALNPSGVRPIGPAHIDDLMAALA